jgi:hypothetical protein
MHHCCQARTANAMMQKNVLAFMFVVDVECEE